jgi:hypothetical protein
MATHGHAWSRTVKRARRRRATRAGIHVVLDNLSAHSTPQIINNRIEHWNTNPRPFVWVKTAEQILESLTAYCQRLMTSINKSVR